jgi:hypothetical protein
MRMFLMIKAINRVKIVFLTRQEGEDLANLKNT